MFLRRVLVDNYQRVGEIELKGFHPVLEEEKDAVQTTVNLIVNVPHSITQEMIETALGPITETLAIKVQQLEDGVDESRFQLTYEAKNILPMQELDFWQTVFQKQVINPNKQWIDYRQ